MNTSETPHSAGSVRDVAIAIVSLIALTATCYLSSTTGSQAWTILFLLSQATVISIIIWQACDPFADAAQWIGTTLRLPGSVRGATLDAIASSMPELLSGIFFVVLAISANQTAKDQLAAATGEGYGATVATCAGSAVYNMILIPAICALVIAKYRPQRPTIDVEDKVISRDGLWFVGCEVLLLFFLFQPAMHWWMGVALLGAYLIYLIVLFRDAKLYQRRYAFIRQLLDNGQSNDQIAAQADSQNLKLSRDLIQKIRDLGANRAEEDDQPPETAGVLFGFFDVPLSFKTAWIVIGVSTVIAAGACYWLVEVTQSTAHTLDVPLFFVAVILAAAASSVPDTFLSVGAAMRGDDDGALSNAFGSNIFDICVCLSIPLLVGSFLNGWQPILLTQDGEPMVGLSGLRILLCSLTMVTLLIMWHNRQLTKQKAYILIGLYGLFVAYAVAGSVGLTLF